MSHLADKLMNTINTLTDDVLGSSRYEQVDIVDKGLLYAVSNMHEKHKALRDKTATLSEVQVRQLNHEVKMLPVATAMVQLEINEKIKRKYLEERKQKIRDLLDNDAGYIRHIEDPDLETRMYAVSVNPCVLAHIKEQTEEMCLMAVTEAGQCLSLCKIITDNVIHAALTNDVKAIIHVPDPTYAEMEYVIHKDPSTITLIEDVPYDLLKYALGANGLLLGSVSDQTDELVKIALGNNRDAVKHARHISDELARDILTQHSDSIRHIKNPSQMMIKLALEQDVNNLRYIDTWLIDHNTLIKVLSQDIKLTRYTPDIDISVITTIVSSYGEASNPAWLSYDLKLRLLADKGALLRYFYDPTEKMIEVAGKQHGDVSRLIWKKIK